MYQIIIQNPVITRKIDIKANENYKNKLKESEKKFERTNIENKCWKKCWKLSEYQLEPTLTNPIDNIVDQAGISLYRTDSAWKLPCLEKTSSLWIRNWLNSLSTKITID